MQHRVRMIGVFTAELDDAYQAEIWRGIERRADEHGIGVVCFLGGRVNSPVVSEGAANVAYGIADYRNVDGLILVSSAIMTFMSPETLPMLYNPGRNIPQVSVGLKLPDIPCITVDGTEGIIEVIRHLKEVHHRKTFALIGGPTGHTEAAERKRTFLETLERFGLPVDERLFFSGLFVQESGAEAAKALIGRGLPCDAIVCMNDRMAIGAMHELRKAGIRVPEDVSVVGFDGIEESASMLPSLTTIVQPLDQLGSAAVDVLVELLEGRRPSDRVLDCGPEFRESCGCPPGRHYRFNVEKLPEAVTEEDRKFIAELIGVLESGDFDAFIAVLNRALLVAAFGRGNLSRWNDYLSYIRAAADTGKGGGHPIPGTLFELARVLIGETESRLQSHRRLATERRFAALRSISAALSGAFEIPVLLKRLTEGLKLLGIRGSFLVLFDGVGTGKEQGRVPEQARFMMASGTSASWSPLCGSRFPTHFILPPEIGTDWRKERWVFSPLVFQNEPLGYLLYTSEQAEPTLYDSLREAVSTALKGALILEQIRTHEHRLEAQVARRTAELTRANQELRKENERRTRLEQEVIEISNQTMQRIGQDLHDDLCQHLAGISMFVSVVRNKLSPSSRKDAQALERISDMLSDSITRVKQIARGLVPIELEAWGFASAVEALVESAQRRFQVQISFTASSDFSISDRDRALQIFRIVQEAISNALNHSGSDRIDVKLYSADCGNGRCLVSEVTDYGSGFQEAETHRGMGLRIMRYRAEKADAEIQIEQLHPGTRVSCRIRNGQDVQK